MQVIIQKVEPASPKSYSTRSKKLKESTLQRQPLSSVSSSQLDAQPMNYTELLELASVKSKPKPKLSLHKTRKNPETIFSHVLINYGSGKAGSKLPKPPALKRTVRLMCDGCQFV